LVALANELISKIGGGQSTLLSIDGVEEAYFDVFVAINADEDGGGTCEFQLSKENLCALERIGVPAHFTVAVVKK
jgi:hypothetical protein